MFKMLASRRMSAFTLMAVLGMGIIEWLALCRSRAADWLAEHARA